jgi:predicted aspartyl protease
LVDSGATNNFISRRIAEKFGLKITKSSDIIVKLADGKTVTTQAYATCVVQLGPLSVSLRFELLEANIATILGMPFLETCNP